MALVPVPEPAGPPRRQLVLSFEPRLGQPAWARDARLTPALPADLQLSMPKKRRNGGRSRKGRGKTRQVDCVHCMCKPPKDKAVHRFNIRNIVDSGAMNDLRAACAIENYVVPKLYAKSYYCISCAVHSRIVRVRNREARRNRDPPVRFRRRPEGERKEGAGDRRGPRKAGEGAAAGAAAAGAAATDAAPAAVPAAAE